MNQMQTNQNTITPLELVAELYLLDMTQKLYPDWIEPTDAYSISDEPIIHQL